MERRMDAAAADAQPRPLLLAMRGIEKSYPGVAALKGVDFELRSGEVMALMGENGAGKSTLMKVLGGAVLPDAGLIEVAGRPVAVRDPVAAREAGIAMIHQELALVPALSARENIFLGQERTRGGFVRAGEERAIAGDLLRRLGVAVDPDLPCRRLSLAQQQAVEIAKALAVDARIIILDEPTVGLDDDGLVRLEGVLRAHLAAGGTAMVSTHVDLGLAAQRTLRLVPAPPPC